MTIALYTAAGLLHSQECRATVRQYIDAGHAQNSDSVRFISTTNEVISHE